MGLDLMGKKKKKISFEKITENILTGIVKAVSGKKNKHIDFYKEAFKKVVNIAGLSDKVSEIEQKATQWIVFQALMNPNIAGAIFQLRSLINDNNALVLLGIAKNHLVLSSEKNANLLGLAIVSAVSQKFKIDTNTLLETKNAVVSLTESDDEIVRSAAIIVLDVISGIGNIADIEKASIVLKDAGIDI